MYQVIRRLRRSLPKSLGCQRRVDCFAHAGNLFRIGRSKEREDSVCGEEQLKRQQLKGKEDFKFSSRESAHSSRSRFFLNLVTSSSSSSYILLCCAPLYPYVLTNKVFVSDYLLGLDLNNKFGTLCDLF